MVAFEHGTLRDFPFEDSANGRCMSLAYKKARRVIITNADGILSARRMGLKHVEFIPHPVDETKFSPRATPLATRLRETHGCDHIIFCPARQNWALKGNDKMIRAFAGLPDREKLKAVLLLCSWGQEVDESRRLIAELGIEPRVCWLPPLSKMKLVEFYNAADMVLDQFTLGAFGTTTPEAMACGKPVMLYFNDEVHKWCFPEMPPVIHAFSEEEIRRRLVELLQSPDERSAVGRQARAWVEKHHGWELVADRQIRLYREVLDR
jgi:glycosyltransferase involved in cell wall biosynthesis